MKKSIIALAIATTMLTGPAMAEVLGPNGMVQAVGGRLYTTYDTEHNYKSVASAEFWENTGDQRLNRDHANFGIAVSDTLYVNPMARYMSQGAQFIVDINNKDYYAGGGLGIGTINNKQFLLGDTWGGYNINKNISIDGGINGDIVDSVVGLENNITRIGASIGADIHTEGGTGIAFGATRGSYSMGNLQQGAYSKLYTEVYEGVNIYFRTKSYTNSMPYNGFFYAPDHYARYLTGVSFKKVVSDSYLVAGWLDVGSSVSDAVWSPAHTAKVSVDTLPVQQGWTYGATIGTDVNAASNYQYFYTDVHAKYTF